MRFDLKISPALFPFLDEQSGDTHRDAIVLLRSSALDPADARSDRNLAPSRVGIPAKEEVQASIVEAFSRVEDRYGSVMKKRKTPSSEGFTPVREQCIPVAKVPVTRNTLLDLAEMDEVVAILPNLKLELIDPKETKFEGANNDERRDGMTWGLKELNIVEIWNRGYSGKGVKVAVLDTGVFGSHPILKGRVEEFVVVDPIGNRCALTDGQSFDADRHGTHVCGTIAGGKTGEDVSVGIAPDATLLVAAVLVGRTTLWTLMQGIDWAVSRGARVINLSLGLRSYEPKLSELCKLLVDDYNVIPVAAIGNEGHGNTSSPGNAPGALSVGAVDKGYRGRLSIPFFSSGASLVVDEQVSAGSQSIVNKPDIVAPGVGVLSCIPPEDRYDGRYDWAAMNGTSMAAPHVSGVAALLAQAVPKANAAAIIDVLKESADYTRGGIRPDNRWGMGVIRPVKALELLEERCRSAGKNQRKVK